MAMQEAAASPNTSAAGAQRRGRFFYGWWVVLASSLQGMFGNGSVSNGFPIFFEPIRIALGLSYTQMSLVFGMARAEGGVGGPLVGWLVDRFGARPMILFGGLTAGIGMILLSRVTEYWQLIVLFVGVVSVGKTAGLGQTLMALVNHWFVRRKALAMSTLMTSFAGGGAIVVPLLGLGITHLGWRDTLLYTGVFMTAITIPVCLVIRSKPEDLGMRPDGDGGATPIRGRHEKRRAGSEVLPGDFTVRQSTKTVAFWLMLGGTVLRVAATNGILVHLFPLLQEKGLSPQTAALYASIMFFVAIPLRFVLGVGGGKISSRQMLFWSMNLGGAGVFALFVWDNPAAIVAFLLGIAMVEGVTSANWIMLGDYFGRSRFASLMGFMSVFHNIGLVISPIYFGWLKDHQGNYDLALLTFVPLYVLSALAFALARKPAPPPATPAVRPPQTASPS